MGSVRAPSAVKPFAGFIFRQQESLEKAKKALSRALGPIDSQTEPCAFTHTDYYAQEFGVSLQRSFASFTKLIRPDELSRLKIFTNRLEKRFSSRGGRLINIDPGYLDSARVVLATTKDYRHRLYLGRGIYAEVTLFYGGNTYCPWEWTYPDYRLPETVAFFNAVRRIYVAQQKAHP